MKRGLASYPPPSKTLLTRFSLIIKLFINPRTGLAFGNFNGSSQITNPAVTLIFDTVLANAPSVSGNLVMNGTGTLILRQANTFSGTITINAGSLDFGNGSTTGSAGSSSGITNNATLTFNRSNTMTQGTDFSVISGS